MGNFELKIQHYDSIWISYMAAILIFFMISSLKPYVGLSCNFVEDIGRGNNLRHSMDVANT